MKQKHKKTIDRAIESINWNKVADMYKKTNWTWYLMDQTPTEEELKDSARTLAQRAIKEKLRFISTGGITIIWEKKRNFMQIFVGYSGDNK